MSQELAELCKVRDAAQEKFEVADAAYLKAYDDWVENRSPELFDEMRKCFAALNNADDVLAKAQADVGYRSWDLRQKSQHK